MDHEEQTLEQELERYRELLRKIREEIAKVPDEDEFDGFSTCLEAEANAFNLICSHIAEAGRLDMPA